MKPYDRIENASRDEITALQIERLKWTLHHAYRNVATYREKFDAAGVHPGDFHDLGDLARFPATTKDDLRSAYPYGMFAVPRERVVRVHASSGTTGTATVVGYTQGDIDTWAALMARTIHAHGGRAGDIVLISYGYGLFTGGLGAHYGAERLGCMVIPASGGQTERQAQLIRDLKPAILMATPSYALNIAEELDRQTGNAAASSLRIGSFGAEPWSQAMRVEIERRLGIEALDIYGLSEVMGPGVAAECAETKDGLTVWEDHFYPEVIDPETGARVPDGTAGELVLTTLTKEALPLIRYRTRDLTRLLPPSARTMRRIAPIGGRSDDMLIVRGINLFPSEVEALVLDDPRLAPHYVIEVSREGALDALLLRVERRESEAVGGLETAAPELARRIKDLLGVSATVRVEAPGAIERSAGKAKRVIDHRAG